MYNHRPLARNRFFSVFLDNQPVAFPFLDLSKFFGNKPLPVDEFIPVLLTEDKRKTKDGVLYIVPPLRNIKFSGNNSKK